VLWPRCGCISAEESATDRKYEQLKLLYDDCKDKRECLVIDGFGCNAYRGGCDDSVRIGVVDGRLRCSLRIHPDGPFLALYDETVRRLQA
jgi:hypothetical protein